MSLFCVVVLFCFFIISPITNVSNVGFNTTTNTPPTTVSPKTNENFSSFYYLIFAGILFVIFLSIFGVYYIIQTKEVRQMTKKSDKKLLTNRTTKEDEGSETFESNDIMEIKEGSSDNSNSFTYSYRCNKPITFEIETKTFTLKKPTINCKINLNVGTSLEGKKLVAMHESSHATCAFKNSITVLKVTIKANKEKGYAGCTFYQVQEKFQKKSDFVKTLTVMLVSCAAEEHFYGQFSDGCKSDLAQATILARYMVEHLGMSDLFPLVKTDDNTNSKFNEEAKKILDIAWNDAKEFVKENSELIKFVSEKLLKNEEIDGIELKRTINEYQRQVKNKNEAKSVENKKENNIKEDNVVTREDV